MKLSAPTQIVFFISMILGILGLLSGFGIVSVGGANTFYIMTAAWVVLTGGVVLKGV
ncbi:MAG: hypothetical protein AAF197_12480 [Pseudomonadota bacterium]